MAFLERKQVSKIISTNPAKNYDVIGEVEVSSDVEIDKKVGLANKQKEFWKDLGVEKRIELLKPIYSMFQKRQAEMIKIIIEEVGKTKAEALNEMDFYLGYFQWFMENGKQSLADEVTFEDEKNLNKVIYEPIGSAAVITPWNFPFGMFVWGVIPNLIAGNTVIFKISEECPLAGKLIEEIMLSCNLPEGVFSEIYGSGDIGSKLVDNKIDLIWFTGSSKVGKELYKKAADKFIKAILEMGGSNPFVVFEDADLDQAVEKIYSGRFYINGQTCDATKKLVVHESVQDKLVRKLIKKIENKIIGDPNNSQTDIGSLAAKRQLDRLAEQVKDALDKEAKAIVSGKMSVNLQGAYYPPTILTNITKDMKVWREEVFGPVLPIMTFSSDDEAINLSNDTVYGLGAVIFTNDLKRAKNIAGKIKAGNVEINNADHWLACNPFGGYKESGIGREHGKYGFHELCQIKIISEIK